MASMATIWTAIGTVATIVGVGVPLIRRRSKRRYRIFLSMQMSQLSDEDYLLVRQQILNVIYDMRKHDDVYFFNELVPDRNAFQERTFDALEYLSEIRKADYFVAVLSERILSSIFFEAGYAVATGKQSFYFLLNRQAMPLIMRTAIQDHPKVKVIELPSMEELGVRLSHLLENTRRIDDLN